MTCQAPIREYRPKRGVASEEMPVERFIWTIHAERRRRRRLLDRLDVERTIRDAHSSTPRINRGQANWVAHGLCTDGRCFTVVYDHPHRRDDGTARIVSVWIR